MSYILIMLQELTNGHMCRLMLPELTSSPGSKLKLLFLLDPSAQLVIYQIHNQTF